MKKTLLALLTVLAFAGISMAQDVYTASFYYNEVGTDNAAVFKNGELLYSRGDDPSFFHMCYDVLCLNGDVYWVDYYYDTHTEDYGNVYKNGAPYLINENGTCIETLFTDGIDIYSAGYKIINNVKTPAVWKGTSSTPFVMFDTGGKEGWIENAEIENGIIYACGIKDSEGVVWDSYNGEILNFGEKNYVDDLAFYNGSVYTVVNERSDDWRAWVYCDSYELYTLSDEGSGYALSMDAGDIYVFGADHSVAKIWKNGAVLYEHPEMNDYLVDIVANSEGIYYLTDRATYKDGVKQYESKYNCAMFVDLDCQHYDARTLPYYENFETGATDWECWWQLDLDQANNGYASYWHRGGDNAEVSAYGGHYCAWHRYNGVYDQNGLLATPLISIPADGNTTMTFKTYEQYPNDYGYEGVWVIEGGHKASVEVWTQTEPSAEWKTVSIDLSAYQGKNVQIDFRYQGQNGHSWYIDDVTIVSDYQPCPPVSAPYVERFDTGLGDCMYVMDVDHDGVCWEWDSSRKAAIHTFGSLHNQGGALLTPSIILSAGKSYQLNFDYNSLLPKGESSNAVEYSVWMAVDNTGFNNLDNFNEIWRITPSGGSAGPGTANLDLAPYSGHTIQFAFVYEGNDIYTWLLDNIEVAEKTGIGENEPPRLAVYPNPARQSIRIEGLDTASEVQVYNTLGELVKTVKVDANNEINIAELAVGLYLVRCSEVTMRFVKE